MSKKKTIILALFVMFLWGSLYPMVKLGFTAYQVKTTGDILLFAGIRFTICGLIISAFAFFKDKKSFIPVKTSIPQILLSGAFAVILHYTFIYVGLSLTESSKTAILEQVGLLFYVCFSFLFFKDDTLSAKKLIGAFVGFLGIIAINISSTGFSFHLGDVFVISASFCTVFSNVVCKKTFTKVEPITATGCSQLFGGIVLLIVGLCMGGKVQFALDSSLWIMGYILIASILSYCVWYKIIKENNLSNMFIIKFAEPLISCILGALLLQENVFQWQYLLAFVLIASGIVLSNYKPKNKAKEKTDK